VISGLRANASVAWRIRFTRARAIAAALGESGETKLDGARLPREASPAKEAKNGQHNNDDDDDPKPGWHVILSLGGVPTLRRADPYLQGDARGVLSEVRHGDDCRNLRDTATAFR
jgi:hypothetical protein